jgi:hypothetical protein
MIFLEASFSRPKTFPDFIIYLSASIVLIWSLLFYCGFAALHAVQHVSDPAERAWWVILTVVFNIAGSCIYYFTKYQAFRKIGKAGITLKSSRKKQKLSELSEEEKSNQPVQPTSLRSAADQ